MGELQCGDLTDRIMAAAVEVHRNLGPGLLESAYRSCLCRQFELAGLAVETEVPIPVEYKGCSVATGYRADMIVERAVLLELKAVERLLPIHVAQTLTYLRLARLRVALLLNFNITSLRLGGVRRLIC
jgi:GxxExxY protein